MHAFILAAAHNCNGSKLCGSGNAALGAVILVIIIYYVGRWLGIWK